MIIGTLQYLQNEIDQIRRVRLLGIIGFIIIWVVLTLYLNNSHTFRHNLPLLNNPILLVIIIVTGYVIATYRIRSLKALINEISEKCQS